MIILKDQDLGAAFTSPTIISAERYYQLHSATTYAWKDMTGSGTIYIDMLMEKDDEIWVQVHTATLNSASGSTTVQNNNLCLGLQVRWEPAEGATGSINIYTIVDGGK